MRGIWMLMRRDLRRATSNTMAVIVMVGVCILPSLFTWFNVIASWDPFSNVKNLTVAVANTDEGYQSDLIPLRLNIGDQVVAQLRTTQDFNWVVTSQEEAIDGTKSGEYYAAIVLPPSFSKDMLTFYDTDAQRTDIAYYTNEKKNALAPKLTGQGADRVSSGINTVFTQTLGEVGVSILSSLSQYLDSADTQALFTRLESHIGEAATQLRAAATTTDTFTTLITSSQGLVRSSAALITATGQTMDDASGAIGGGVAAAGSLQTTIETATQGLSSALELSSRGYADVRSGIDAVFNAADDQSHSQVGVLQGMAQQVQAQIDDYTTLRTQLQTDIAPLLPDGALDPVLEALDAAITHLGALKDALDLAASHMSSGNANAQASHQELSDIIDQAQAAVDALKAEYDTDLKSQLDQLSGELATALQAAGTVGDDLDAAGAGLSGASGTLLDQLDHAQATTSEVSASLTQAADTFDHLREALETARTTGDLSALKGVLSQDPSSVAASLAAPVAVNRVAVFPVANFGSAMAPLYTMLALWVGALLIVVSVQVGVHRDALAGVGPLAGRHAPGVHQELAQVPGIAGVPELRAHQKYLGRYGIFALIGLVQSTLVCGGSLIFVHVQSVHPWLYMLCGWVTSLVFTLTVYTAVVAFGNAGKALCVLLLVVQISASGGAYPLQLLPEWFQNLSVFLPATYAVDAFRAAIAGTYDGDYWVALGTLALFILPALLLGLVLRRPLISFNRNLAEALESTKLM